MIQTNIPGRGVIGSTGGDEMSWREFFSILIFYVIPFAFMFATIWIVFF